MGLSPPLLPLLAWAALPGPGTLPFGPGASVGQEGRRAGPVEGAPVVRRLGAMGTWLEVEVRAAGRPAALAAIEAAVRAIEAAEARLSTWREDTELARWNAEAGALEPRPLSAELADELGRALELADETGGAFDPACANLVEAYGLRGDGRWPAADELDRARERTGYAHLVLESRTLRRLVPGVRIEEGAFGKGAALDAALRAADAAGAESVAVDLGGQIAFRGAPRPVSLADPRDRERPCLRLTVEPGSLATTANGVRGRVVDGRPLGHVLDPRTGRPAPEIGSVSVWAPDALTADALSTGLYVLGAEAALAYAERHPGIEVLVIGPAEGPPAAGDEPSLRARASAGLAGRVEVLVEDVVLSIEPSGGGTGMKG